jgi:hypothetical protein
MERGGAKIHWIDGELPIYQKVKIALKIFQDSS